MEYFSLLVFQEHLQVAPWYLYKMVTQNILRMCKGKQKLLKYCFIFVSIFNINEWLKHTKTWFNSAPHVRNHFWVILSYMRTMHLLVTTLPFVRDIFAFLMKGKVQKLLLWYMVSPYVQFKWYLIWSTKSWVMPTFISCLLFTFEPFCTLCILCIAQRRGL